MFAFRNDKSPPGDHPERGSPFYAALSCERRFCAGETGTPDARTGCGAQPRSRRPYLDCPLILATALAQTPLAVLASGWADDAIGRPEGLALSRAKVRDQATRPSFDLDISILRLIAPSILRPTGLLRRRRLSYCSSPGTTGASASRGMSSTLGVRACSFERFVPVAIASRAAWVSIGLTGG